MIRFGIDAMLLALISLAFVAGAAADRTPEAPPAAVDAVDALRKQLGAALRGAIEEEGPIAAIDVCRDKAPQITKALQNEGVAVGRTSHRLRNPDNAPMPWMKPLLEELRDSTAAPGRFRVVDLGEAGTGYVEAIYLQPLCATCHGSNIAPALHDEIRARYPDDRATGFEPGEFRGLFWAVVPKPAS